MNFEGEFTAPPNKKGLQLGPQPHFYKDRYKGDERYTTVELLVMTGNGLQGKNVYFAKGSEAHQRIQDNLALAEKIAEDTDGSKDEILYAIRTAEQRIPTVNDKTRARLLSLGLVAPSPLEVGKNCLFTNSEELLDIKRDYQKDSFHPAYQATIKPPDKGMLGSQRQNDIYINIETNLREVDYDPITHREKYNRRVIETMLHENVHRVCNPLSLPDEVKKQIKDVILASFTRAREKGVDSPYVNQLFTIIESGDFDLRCRGASLTLWHEGKILYTNSSVNEALVRHETYLLANDQEDQDKAARELNDPRIQGISGCFPTEDLLFKAFYSGKFYDEIIAQIPEEDKKKVLASLLGLSLTDKSKAEIELHS